MIRVLTLLASRRPAVVNRAVTITSRHRPARTGLALVAACALLTACQTSGNSVNTGKGSDNQTDGQGQTATTSYTIEQPVARIAHQGRAGKVTVTAKDGPVAVTERARWSTREKPVTSHTVEGDALRLREDGCPYRDSGQTCQVAWDITAPAGTVLELDADAGGIEVRGMAGKLTLRADAGGIEARDLRSRAVDANADAGGVQLDFAEAPDDVTAKTDAGGVEITVPAGASYAVRAKVGAGSKTVEVPQDPGSPRRIKAEADAGGVEITAR